MIQSHTGEFAALLTAFLWTITAVAFESASKKIGSLTVNLIRLFLALLFLSLYNWIFRGHLFPSDATSHNVVWLTISGIVGFTLGDLFLFEAYVVVGSRISMLIMSLTPPITALIGWITIGEQMTPMNFLGMALTITGIILVLLKKQPQSDLEKEMKTRKKVRLNYPLIGILLAFGGSVGQGTGLVLSKIGMQDYDPFAASQIRVAAGIVGFSILFVFLKRWNRVFKAIRNKKAMVGVSIGAFFGPFLGVSFSLLSVKYTTTGIASTIMAIVPILIIPPSIIFFKEKITLKEVIGALIAVSGVAIFFI